MNNLAEFKNSEFNRGASSLKEFLWRLLQQSLFNIEWITMYKFKCIILQRFGAKVAAGVVIKPKAKITFPWKVLIGENSWIGEETWLLSLEQITIGSNVCISQRTFLCTGSHNWSAPTFNLITKPIIIEDGVWICANVFVGPGVTIGENSVVKVGSVVTHNLPPDMICAGNPCRPVKPRIIT